VTLGWDGTAASRHPQPGLRHTVVLELLRLTISATQDREPSRCFRSVAQRAETGSTQTNPLQAVFSTSRSMKVICMVTDAMSPLRAALVTLVSLPVPVNLVLGILALPE
jgi:hypothetical protein